MIFGAAIGGLVLGFLAGLLSFKIKSTWCPDHGIPKTCMVCESLKTHGLTHHYKS